MPEEKNAVQRLYSEPKALKFVNHLISAYLPVHKPSKVWEFKKTQKPKCNICGQKLMTLGEALGLMYANQEKIMEGTMENIKKQLNDQEVTADDNPVQKHVAKGRVLAWTGEKTDTLLCAGCIRDLLDLIQTGVLMGDKNLTWKLNNMRRKEIFNHFTENPHLDDKEKAVVKDIEKRVERSKEKKITTLGDLGVLQELKAKMEAEKNGTK